MGVTVFLIALAVVLLAYSNGANDNFKGVATLFGSGIGTYRAALCWATITTLAGALMALVLAAGLVDSFRGRGLVPDEVAREPAFLLSVSLGAALTVLIATWTGLPVSTTHALIGGLLGAGLIAAAGDVRLSKLGTSFVLPLIFSPIVAMTLAVAAYPLLRLTRRRMGVTSRTCVCIGAVYEEAQPQPDGRVLLVRTGTLLDVNQASVCAERYQGRVLGVEAGRLLGALHYLSSGAVGFARGLNDTPKIVAMLLAVQVLPDVWALAAVASVMAIGGLLNARKVAETMSKKITSMNPGQGFTANMVTALLVATASRFGLPVSTTHVSVGSLFGIGVVNRTARLHTIASILLAWVITLPLAATLSSLCYLLVCAFV